MYMVMERGGGLRGREKRESGTLWKCHLAVVLEAHGVGGG
jgi:hypothetical protein